MINVTITPHGTRMEGHAGYHIDGRDIVCAAVSALTCSMVNSLRELAGLDPTVEEFSGYMDVKWGEINKTGSILVDSWFLGLLAIDQEYHCINFVA